MRTAAVRSSLLAPGREAVDTSGTMRTRRPTFLRHVLALAFTLVLPVASAHCVTMALLASPATTAVDGVAPMRADHSCCATSAAAGTRGTPAPGSATDCACIGLPSATAPATQSLEAPAVVATPIAIDATLAPPTHLSLPRAPRWSDPPPVAPAIGAFSLRGPPAQG